MSEPLAYIVTGALMNCDKGAAIMPFTTLPRTTTVDGIMAANASDMIPLVNIPSFVMCTVGQPAPCVPMPTPAPGTGHPMGGGSVWHDTGEKFSTVAGLPPVLFRSCARCAKGGKISFLTTGQIPMSELDPTGELQQKIDDINAQADELKEENEKGIDWVDLGTGFIPVYGSARDASRSWKAGNKWTAVGHGILAATDLLGGFLIKGGVKAAKAGGKITAKVFFNQMGKKLAGLLALKTAAKELLEKGVKEALEKLAIKGRKLATACFPAGTSVAVEGGFKNIEDIKIGDLVWSYNPDTLETGLKEVVDAHQSIADSTIQLTIGNEVIETTTNHPFYTKQGWKDAGRLTTDDEVKSKNEKWEQIRAINFSTIGKKVYNFTVKDWHTYFVGACKWLVHNSCSFWDNILKKPQEIWGKSVDDIADELTEAGYEVAIEQSTKGSKLSTQIRVKGHPKITNIQVHPGGGSKVGSYYKISTSTEGIIKVVNPKTYVPHPLDKARIVNIGE